jgi:anti-sigma B factor antagonist
MTWPATAVSPDSATAPLDRPVLTVEISDNSKGLILCRLVGELDLSTICQFREALAGIAPGSRLLIDMSGVSFLDSAGLGALVGSIRRTREFSGDVAVTCHRHVLLRLLFTVGLDRVVTITDNIEDAMAAL